MQDYDGPRTSGVVNWPTKIFNSANGYSDSETFTITDDSAAEPDETITLAVPIASVNPGGITITGGDPITITIAANDGYSRASLGGADATLSEGATVNVPVNFQDTTARSADAMVAFSITGTATAADYAVTTGGGVTFDATAATGSITVAASATAGAIPITITADSADDEGETLIVTLTSYTGGGSGILQAVDSAARTYTLVDSVRTLTVTCNPASVTEGASATCTIALADGDTAFTSPTAVTWTVTHGDTVDADFAAVTGSVMFPTVSTFALTPADDDLDEDAEAFTVQLSVADATADGGTAFGAAASVSVADNDTAGLVITPSPLPVPQNGMAEYTVRLATQPVDAAAAVTVTVSGGGSTVNFAPMTALTFTAAAWNTAQTVTVTAADAAMVDDTATLTHAVSGDDEYENADNSLDERLTVTINAVRTLTVTGPASITEGVAGTFNIALARTAFTNPTEVTWTVTHGDTVAADFAAVTGSVMFPTQTSFAITPADDNLDEDAEAFTVQLSVADDSADGGTAFGAAASVSVADNDTAGLVIAPSPLPVPQNGMAEYTVRLATQPVDAAAAVTVTVSGGGSTVNFAPMTALTFTAAAWNTAQTVTVTAADAAMVDDTATLTHAVSGDDEYENADNSLDERLTVTIIARATAQATHELLLPEVTRAVAGEVFGAIAERAGGVGGRLNGAGFSLNGQSSWSDIAATQASALAAGGGDGATGDILDIDSKELLRGLQFAMPVSAGASHGKHGYGANLAFWGGSDYRDFGGEDGDDDWDGTVFSMRFGVDGQVRDNLRAGVMLSYSDAETEYTMVADGNTSKGDYELDLTSVSPYLRWNLGGGHAWASVSYGSGEVEVKPNDGDAATHDVTMTGAAFGGERKLLEQNGRELSVRADAFVAESEVEGDGDTNTAGIDDDLDADANRVRVALAWSYPGRFAAGQLSPAFDLGLRHDGGDGRTGAGLELGGSLRFHAPDVGLTLEGNARALIGHSGDHRGWGIGGLMRVQNGADGQGLAVSVAPSYGGMTGGGLGASGALWKGGLAAAASAGPVARLDAEVTYGVPAESGMLTPYSALRFGDANRDYRLGFRWRAARLDLDVFARHADGATADNAVTVEGRLRF